MNRRYAHHSGFPLTSPTPARLLLAVLILALPLISACGNSIEPLTEDGEAVLAIYGYLDMRSDKQFIRLEALRPTILSDEVSLEGIEVVSVYEERGSVELWSDSSVVLDDGTLGTVFWANFTPELEGTYAFTFQRGGIILAEATSKLPEPPPVILSIPVGDTLSLVQGLALGGVTQQPGHVIVEYVVGHPNESTDKVFRVGYGAPGMKTNTGWELDVFLGADRHYILSQLGEDTIPESVIFKRISIEMTLLSQEWERPREEHNLKNAHGFLGSVGVFNHSWHLDSATLAIMKFQDGQQ